MENANFIYATIAAAAVIVTAIAFLIRKLSVLDSIKDSVKYMDCLEHKKKMSSISDDISFIRSIKDNAKHMDCIEHRKKMNSMSDDISFIRGKMELLIQYSCSAPNQSPVQTCSPISLSQLGKTLADDMNLIKKIERNWEQTRKYLDEHFDANPEFQNAYDIQQFCITVASVSLDRLFSEHDVECIKNYAFKNGNPLVYYGNVIGVMIRDKYIEYKGIIIPDDEKQI